MSWLFPLRGRGRITVVGGLVGNGEGDGVLLEDVFPKQYRGWIPERGSAASASFCSPDRLDRRNCPRRVYPAAGRFPNSRDLQLRRAPHSAVDSTDDCVEPGLTRALFATIPTLTLFYRPRSTQTLRIDIYLLCATSRRVAITLNH